MDDATPLRAARVERVLFLQRQPCIRAMKYAVALRERHPAIELGFAYQGKTLTGWNGAGDELFARWWRLPLRGTDEAFERIVNDFAPDVVHSHNLPDVLTVMAARVLGDSTPVVHDIHDLQSLRRTPYEDGFADPQDPIRAEKEAIAAAGLSIDVYPNRDARAYRELAARTPGMTIHDTLAPAELLRRLPAYDVGWAAFNTGLNAAHLDTALPNKAFEYLASGLPVAAGRHKALKGLIREHGVGVVVDHPAELPAALAAAGMDRLRARVAERRHHFTVESNIDALVDLYRECLGPEPEPLEAGRARVVAG